MKLSKKAGLFATLLATAVLAGCQSQSNVLTFTTPAPMSSFNTNNQGTLVNVATQDLRNSAEVSSYTTAGKVTRLTASPDVTQLFQQAMQQNLNSKGFSIVNSAGHSNVLVNIKKFYADVESGNLLYKVTANVNVDVNVQGSKGNFTKNFSTSRSYEGAFSADNTNIQKVLSQAYTDAIQTIYNDNEIANAIHQYK
ncbi:hypothetical protein BMT54_04590 [Pasteurellaceae bacterium 15-036681]|nr:hypothetical protein BMT54_04590 [Pasteurellaceae bacterium 15-036681]